MCVLRYPAYFSTVWELTTPTGLINSWFVNPSNHSKTSNVFVWYLRGPRADTVPGFCHRHTHYLINPLLNIQRWEEGISGETGPPSHRRFRCVAVTYISGTQGEFEGRPPQLCPPSASSDIGGTPPKPEVTAQAGTKTVLVICALNAAEPEAGSRARDIEPSHVVQWYNH